MANVLLLVITFSQTGAAGQRRRGLKGLWQEVAIFQQTAANFRQKRLRVLRISILPRNSSEIGDFQPHILYFWTKVYTKRKISDKLKF